MGEINPEFGTDGGYFLLTVGDEGPQNLQVRIGSQRDGACHGGHEILAAVGVEGMVSPMCGDDDTLCALAFRNTGGYGKKDAVAEGDNGLFEVVLCVIRSGDSLCPAEQGAFQMGRNAAQVNFVVGYAKTFCLPAWSNRSILHQT